jgi:glycogen debranching enzyme
MEDVLGYSEIDCLHQNPVEHSITLKHNRYFLMADPHGDVTPPGHCSLGLFCDDTRILSHYRLTMRGDGPSLFSTQIDRSFIAQIDLAVNDTEFGGDGWDPRNCLHIRREILLEDRLMERITFTNYLAEPIDFWFELETGCDFVDIFEVRGLKRKKRGEYFQRRIEGNTLISSYRGLDGQLLRCIIRFGGRLPDLTDRRARWDFHLDPNTQFQTEWEILLESVTNPVAGCSFEQKHLEVSDIYRSWAASCSRWCSRTGELNDVIARATDDLLALHVETEGKSILSAGIPWFSTVFGRDSIITSLQTLSLNPAMARETLHYLARHQGSKLDEFTGEQPGKIMHEVRRGEMARTREIPHLPYYGTIDATPLWLILLHETWQWTGDEELVKQLLPNAERALEWIDQYGDLDGDGLVEHDNGPKGGLINQGWKDSNDGVPFPDGRMPKPPIALVEVQGYVYDAKIRMAALYELLGQNARAAELRVEAERLRRLITERFWMEEEGTFGLALDGEKQLMRTITSNAGHLLWSGVPDDEQAVRMAAVLLGPAMFSGWGIRTLSSVHQVFNPMSYHNGSIWPHDNAIVVMGLARYGLATAGQPVVRGIYDAAIHDEFQRLPELFCGMQRGRGKHPVLYPVSCSPQAWASGTFFMLLQSMLGIQPEAHRHALHIRNPMLPDFVDDLTLSNLSIGNSVVSLQFSRYRDRTLANLLSVSGEPLHVQIELN